MLKVVAVTGAAGYIGKKLVGLLKAESDIERVICIDRVACAPDEPCIDIASASVGELVEVLRGVDTVFHLAAARADWGYSYEEYERDNVTVTKNLVEAARELGISKWIYYGTVGVYGASEVALAEDALFRPSSDYAVTKALAEEFLVRVAKELNWDVRIIRPSAVFSEDQPSNTNIYRLIVAISKHRFALIGGGQEIKTTSYLYNLIDATMFLYRDLGAKEAAIDAFNYVDGPKLSTRDMVDIIRSELGVRLPLVVIPLFLVKAPAKIFDWLGNLIGYDFPITSARIAKFCTATNFDSQKIEKAGFSPKLCSREALIKTVKNYCS